MMSAWCKHMIMKWLGKPYSWECNTHEVGGGIRRMRFRKPKRSLNECLPQGER